MMSTPGLDVDAALAELQHLISSVASSHGDDIDPVLITQRLRSLENELRRSDSSARASSMASQSPSPRRQSSLTQIPPSLQVQLITKPSSPFESSPFEEASSFSSSSAAHTKASLAVLTPEPSLHAIRRSVSVGKDVYRPPINVNSGVGGSSIRPPHEEEKWTLSRDGSSDASRSSGGMKRLQQGSTPTALNQSSASHRMDVSFAQQFAGDDPQRLRFVIDAVSNQLQKERRWRRQLQDCVIPTLMQRVEALEEERQRLRQDAAASHHEVTALRLQHAVGGRLELKRRVDLCLESVGELLDRLGAR
jgi:hypothetical protein